MTTFFILPTCFTLSELRKVSNLSEKTETITEVTKEIIAIPNTIPNIATTFPISVTGEISPYPTVETVTSAQ